MASTRTEESVIPGLKKYARSRCFTIAEYHLLKETGVLTTADKVELLDGYVLYKLDHVTLPLPSQKFPDWQQLRKWTQAEFDRMAELGLITPDERVELIDGYLVPKPLQDVQSE
jgi:hypothetical protein